MVCNKLHTLRAIEKIVTKRNRCTLARFSADPTTQRFPWDLLNLAVCNAVIPAEKQANGSSRVSFRRANSTPSRFFSEKPFDPQRRSSIIHTSLVRTAERQETRTCCRPIVTIRDRRSPGLRYAAALLFIPYHTRVCRKCSGLYIIHSQIGFEAHTWPRSQFFYANAPGNPV